MTSKKLSKSFTPASLKRGDLIEVIAPGFGADRVQLLRATEFLQGKGYRVQIRRPVLGGHFLHAHRDEIRAKQLVAALENPECRAVWCLRGGYGSQRLLPYLDKIKKPSQKKWLIGMSDVTALSAYLWQEWRWPSLHGPVLERLAADGVEKKWVQESWSILQRDSIQSPTKPAKVRLLSSSDRKIMTKVTATKHLEGVALGGNLVTYMSLLGGPYFPQRKAERQILFFEDVGERGYRIDRLLTQLQQWPKFRQLVVAVVFGDFSGGKEPGQEKSLVKPVLKRFAQEVDIPVFSGFPFGHSPQQKPWVFGGRAKIFSVQPSQYQIEISS